MSNRATQRCVVVPDDEFKKIKTKMDQLKALNKENHILLGKLKQCKCELKPDEEISVIEEKYETPSHPILTTPIAESEKTSEETGPKSLADEIDYDLVFSKNQKKSARIIAEKAADVFSWNKKGELIDEGQVLDKTNILHIIGFLLNTLHTWKPEDVPEKLEYFLSKLRTTNLPANKIRNQTARQIFVKGKGLVRPRKKSSAINKVRIKSPYFRPQSQPKAVILYGWRSRK